MIVFKFIVDFEVITFLKFEIMMTMIEMRIHFVFLDIMNYY